MFIKSYNNIQITHLLENVEHVFLIMNNNVGHIVILIS